VASSNIADAYYRRSAALAKGTAQRVQHIWKQKIGTADPAGDFWTGGVGEELAQTISVGQFAAAQTAGDYVDSVALDAGLDGSPLTVDARAFAGLTDAGGSLKSALYQGLLQQVADMAAGRNRVEAQSAALGRAVLLGGNETALASRNAEAAAIGAHPKFGGYFRQLTPPSCDRCVVLAGKWYHWNAGFLRHPYCDCIHVPIEAADTTGAPALFSPEGYFAALSRAEQDKQFGLAAAEAIRNGADMGRVINASQSTTIAGIYKGGKKGYIYGQKAIGGRRMRGTPTTLGVGDIMRLAGGDKEKFRQLLAQHGYMVSRIFTPQPFTPGKPWDWAKIDAAAGRITVVPKTWQESWRTEIDGVPADRHAFGKISYIPDDLKLMIDTQAQLERDLPSVVAALPNGLSAEKLWASLPAETRRRFDHLGLGLDDLVSQVEVFGQENVKAALDALLSDSGSYLTNRVAHIAKDAPYDSATAAEHLAATIRAGDVLSTELDRRIQARVVSEGLTFDTSAIARYDAMTAAIAKYDELPAIRTAVADAKAQGFDITAKDLAEHARIISLTDGGWAAARALPDAELLARCDRRGWPHSVIDVLRDPATERNMAARAAQKDMIVEVSKVKEAIKYGRGLCSAGDYARLQREETLKILSEIREMGGGRFPGYSVKSGVAHDLLDYAFGSYPSEWNTAVHDGIGRIDVKYGRDIRGYNADNGATIRIGGTVRGVDQIGIYGSSAEATAVHEVGHSMEEVIAGLKEAEWAFIESRRTSETVESLGKGMEREMYFPGPWRENYTGKDYNRRGQAAWTQSREVFTTGVESLLSGSRHFVGTTDAAIELGFDDELRSFILGVLSGF